MRKKKDKYINQSKYENSRSAYLRPLLFFVMLSPIPCFSAGFFCLLFLCNSFLFFPNLSTSHFSSRSFLPLQDFPSLHFPGPNSSKTPPHRFPKLLFIPCSLLTLPFFFFTILLLLLLLLLFFMWLPQLPDLSICLLLLLLFLFFSFLVNKIRK